MGLRQIGVIHTPYRDSAPYQPVAEDGGTFRIVVRPEYTRALRELDAFRYIYVLYYLNRVSRDVAEVVSPPWTGGFEVGLFASRSPVRPNPIGLSVVQVKGIAGNEIRTSGLDVFDGTPLLDIKPHIRDLDSKSDADYGWLDELPACRDATRGAGRDDSSHLALHIHGIPHDY
jgi:tRNA-Thr(GGU) m(6)t(6)A37 methyltransferase TsaA